MARRKKAVPVGASHPSSLPGAGESPPAGAAPSRTFRDRIVEFTRVRAGDLKPSPRNWRTHPKHQRDALRGILTEVGYVDALMARRLADGSLELVDGHLRAEDNPDQELPVLIVDLDDAEAAKVLATFDPLADLAIADSKLLEQLLAEVNPTVENAELQKMLEYLARDHQLLPCVTAGTADDEPPPPLKARTRPGDLYTLGNHRILCGDSTSPVDVDRLFAGQLAALLFTSPPYSNRRNYTKESQESSRTWLELMEGVFGQRGILTDDAQVLVNLGLIHEQGEYVPYWDPWIQWMRSEGWKAFGWYVWDRITPTFRANDGRLQMSHEWVFHFNKKPVHCAEWVECLHAGEVRAGGAQRTLGGNVKPQSTPGPIKSHRPPESVIRVQRVCDNSDPIINHHPARFPVALPVHIMRSWPEGIVYEPFCGSGSTILAAEQLGRTCYAMELAPAYVDIIVYRWEKMTGKKATLERAAKSARRTKSAK